MVAGRTAGLRVFVLGSGLSSDGRVYESSESTTSRFSRVPTMLNIRAYLERIGYSGPTLPIAENLRELHRAHMFSVPFENLDIGHGRKIICDEASFVRKIIELRRGGFCYELNGVFAALLRDLGFKVTLLSARVARADGSASPEFDHMALLVHLDEPWLADVGFGDSFNEPLQLRPGLDQIQGRRKFRIIEDSSDLHMEMAEPAEAWKRQYSFTLTPRQLTDFAGMCHYHQTSPDSHFTQNRICSKATPEGRITLSGMKLIISRDGEREERLLVSEDEWRAVAEENFGIVV
jgi:N-hydroxyarylamine O-acetyltransferase